MIHLRNVLQVQGYKRGNGPITILQDNMSTLAMIANGQPYLRRSHHIVIRYFFVKGRVDSGELCFEHKTTKDMKADVLTKSLKGEVFIKLRDTSKIRVYLIVHNVLLF